jgi:hypothetical protein
MKQILQKLTSKMGMDKQVNTSEPGRDKGCLQTTFNVNTGMTTEAANVQKLNNQCRIKPRR